MKKVSSYLLLLVLLVVAQACSDENDDPAAEVRDLIERQDSQISSYLSENGIEAEKDQYGVYWVALEENPSGAEINEGDVAEVTYQLSQLDGTLIGENAGDSVRIAFDKNGTYFPVYLNQSLSFMRAGEKYRFYLPFNAAFGSYELPGVIPANSIVVMDLEVKEVYKTVAAIKEADIEVIESVLSDQQETDYDTLGASGVRKVLLEAGEGESPDANDQVSVRYTGKLLSGEVFDTNTGASGELYTFTVGGTNKPIPGFEAGVKSMQEGEKAVFYIPSTEAYGKRASWYVIPEAVREDFLVRENGRYNSSVVIPPHSPLVFEVEVVSLVKKD